MSNLRNAICCKATDGDSHSRTQRHCLRNANRHLGKSQDKLSVSRERLREFYDAARAIEVYKAAAKERQKTSTGGPNPQLSAEMHKAEKGRASVKAGEAFGVSGRTVDYTTMAYCHPMTDTTILLSGKIGRIPLDQDDRIRHS